MSEFIKIVYDNKPYTWSISSDGDDIIASRKLTIEEVAELFGVEVKDILDNKIGIYALTETKENKDEGNTCISK